MNVFGTLISGAIGLEQTRKTDDCIERGAELVAHTREKLIPRSARRFSRDERLMHGNHRFAVYLLGTLLARAQIDARLDPRPKLANHGGAGERRNREHEMQDIDVRVD